MVSLDVLVCGSGIGGPALVYWLARGGHRVVIVERSPILRATGAQIDIRAQRIEVMKRMDPVDVIHSKLVNEAAPLWTRKATFRGQLWPTNRQKVLSL
jgi:2-polyprenyl-6-methoxyphenol hydroxylase-like FAD-dependent oxidoreductase